MNNLNRITKISLAQLNKAIRADGIVLKRAERKMAIAETKLTKLKARQSLVGKRLKARLNNIDLNTAKQLQRVNDRFNNRIAKFA